MRSENGPGATRAMVTRRRLRPCTRATRWLRRVKITVAMRRPRTRGSRIVTRPSHDLGRIGGPPGPRAERPPPPPAGLGPAPQPPPPEVAGRAPPALAAPTHPL